MDLSEFSVPELEELRKDIDITIEQKKKEAKQNLLKEFADRANELGINIDDLLKSSVFKSDKKKVSPKYKNPNNSDETWSGRGRKPKWVINYLDAGNSLENCGI